MSGNKIKEGKYKPLCKILAYADAEVESVDFCRSPYYSSMKALEKANLQISDIDYFEFNEAFSVVGLANNKILGIDDSKVNVNK